MWNRDFPAQAMFDDTQPTAEPPLRWALTKNGRLLSARRRPWRLAPHNPGMALRATTGEISPKRCHFTGISMEKEMGYPMFFLLWEYPMVCVNTINTMGCPMVNTMDSPWFLGGFHPNSDTQTTHQTINPKPPESSNTQSNLSKNGSRTLQTAYQLLSH